MSRRMQTVAVAFVAWLAAGTIAQAQPSPTPTPEPPPAATSSPPPPEPAPPEQTPAPAQSDDPFGEPVMLTPKTIVYSKGNGTWDHAFEILLDAYKSLHAFLDKHDIKPAGPAMTIYTSVNDLGFSFHAAVPIAEEINDPPKGDIEIGRSPEGRALKFTHRGNYDSMDNTYEAITNHLDEHRLEARDLFVEEYRTDLLKTPEEQLIIDIFVPLK